MGVVIWANKSEPQKEFEQDSYIRLVADEHAYVRGVVVEDMIAQKCMAKTFVDTREHSITLKNKQKILVRYSSVQHAGSASKWTWTLRPEYMRNNCNWVILAGMKDKKYANTEVTAYDKSSPFVFFLLSAEQVGQFGKSMFCEEMTAVSFPTSMKSRRGNSAHLALSENVKYFNDVVIFINSI